MSSSPFEHFFDDNLIQICLDKNFIDLNCILGTAEISISIILIIFIILGLKKLLNYYEKINFETSLLIFSIIQIALLDIIIIMPHDFLFECFFFIQICHISLTIKQFIKLARTEKSIFKEYFIFIIINIINAIIFTLYILSLLDIFLGIIYLYIQSAIRIYYFITAIILAFLCRTIINLLKKYEKGNNELTSKKKDSETSNISNFGASFKNNEWMFFLIRERQITPLYILNLICSFIQMLFILSKHFLLEKYFQKGEYTIKILKNNGYIIYYFYLIMCFVNVMVNYYCFYWIVREEYLNDKEIYETKKRKNVLDARFIEKEIKKNESDEKEIKILMDEKVNNKIKFTKSLYANTFTENMDENIEHEEQENYFVQEKDKNNKKIEMGKSTLESISGRGTLGTNNPINQSTTNDDPFLQNF